MIIATTPGSDRNSSAMMQFNFTPPVALDGAPRPAWRSGLGALGAKKKGKSYGKGLKRVWSPANQAWLLMWGSSEVLRIFNTASEADAEAAYLLRSGGGLNGYRFAAGPRGPVGLISDTPSGLAGLGRVRCPEGMTDNGAGVCVCYPGRVLAPDRSKCISPQSPLNTGAMTPAEVMAGQTSRTMSQQRLSAPARRFIESQGYRVNCKISEDWAATPAGGVAPRICNVCGEAGCSGYKHGAYALNLRPQGALPGGVVRAISSGSAAAPPAAPSHPVRAQVLPAGQAPQPPPPAQSIAPGTQGVVVNGVASPPVRPPVSAVYPYYPPGSVTPTAGVTYQTVPASAGPSPVFVSGGESNFASLLSGGFDVGGYTIPYWVLAAGAAYALTRK